MATAATRLLAACGIAALAGCEVATGVQTPAAGGQPRPFGPPVALPVTSTPGSLAPARTGTSTSRELGPRVAAGEGAGASRGASRGAAPEALFGERPPPAGRVDFFVDPALVWQQEPQQPGARQEPAESRWSDFLPIGRDAVLAAGYQLPRAFGFGVAYTRLKRDIEVTEVRTGLGGAPLQTVDFLSVDSDSTVDNVMGRLDAWIFPFWNVSVLGGWTWNESHSDVTVTIPLPINPQSVTFGVPTRQEGPTWGVGTNLSAGYREWFLSGDGQWIRVDMEDFATLEVFLGSIRSGWNGKIDGVPVRVWGGATYWDTATTIAGSASTPGGTLRFEVEQGPVTKYSLQIGANVDIDPGHGVMFEYHFLDDVRMVVLAAALRF
ncbi:MAG TPA: hypothetical protein VFZ65_05435 [Planctomycetota bacterium]|nr:hypothetical protein [Planctomycetota bacterium]